MILALCQSNPLPVLMACAIFFYPSASCHHILNVSSQQPQQQQSIKIIFCVVICSKHCAPQRTLLPRYAEFTVCFNPQPQQTSAAFCFGQLNIYLVFFHWTQAPFYRE